ncbi:hypothetical protein [uncultured Metabacillus sp.]|uniref:hypothetical protein n=1 Tax=uncultured Metabacillus sp. TaxID=2860135 RepID=UPI002607EEDB|nr:hypothetical protein [uncultured Metabacillus sp.]
MDELIKQLQYDEKESTIFIPNEIFTDLQNHIKKSNHIPFAYSYYYLVNWLYRYTKYGGLSIDNKTIKSILGYNPTYTEIDYLIKKNGVLDLMGYCSTVKDYPISWTFEDEILEFVLLSDIEEEFQKLIKESRSRKYTIKLPVKSFYRKEDNEDVMDGTYYEFDRTHLIPFEVFLFCMSNKELGCSGFYLWSYLKMQNQMYSGYDISLTDLANETGMTRRTMCTYLTNLRKYRMVDCYHNQEFFCTALKEDERKANTYVTKEYDLFSDKPVDIKRIEIVGVDKYLEKLDNKAVYDVIDKW